jgi:hypothetical protein
MKALGSGIKTDIAGYPLLQHAGDKRLVCNLLNKTPFLKNV